MSAIYDATHHMLAETENDALHKFWELDKQLKGTPPPSYLKKSVK